MLSADGLRAWLAHIEPVDRAFIACTRPSDRRFAWDEELPAGWWSYRIPDPLSAELEADVRRWNPWALDEAPDDAG